MKNNANAFASAAKMYYAEGNIKMAARYWSRIYSVFEHTKASALENSLALAKVMSRFTDNEVYDITDYTRDRYYRAMGM